MADLTMAERIQARRVFEEALHKTVSQYLPIEEVVIEAIMPDHQGRIVVVARYTIHPDGRFECFDLLDEVLWPSP